MWPQLPLAEPTTVSWSFRSLWRRSVSRGPKRFAAPLWSSAQDPRLPLGQGAPHPCKHVALGLCQGELPMGGCASS